MEANASFQKIVDFLTNLGVQHTDIGDVFRWNKLQLTGNLKNGAILSVMLIDSIETLTNNPNNKAMHQNNCAFTILGKPNVSTAQIDSYDNQNEVLEHCQSVAFEMAARIIKEATETNLQGPLKWLYGNVELASFHYFKVGPVFSNQMYGYRCEFTIKAKEDYTVDVAKWDDL